MSPKEHIKKAVDEGKLMQLATVEGGRPWVCTVYYVGDEDYNLYWLSLPDRRHSLELERDPHAAITIVVKHDKPVIGVQAEGTVDTVNDPELVKKIMQSYVDKYSAGKDFYDNFVAGRMLHRLYRFTPSRYSLFDEVNFKDSSPEEWRL